ncbi:fatty acid oxidation complex subunit alpha [Gemmatimonadetes bacterium T265]|nr:fatty acid oxidation complex subunit alpha [Gemmatimonadetes bacterium T265]
MTVLASTNAAPVQPDRLHDALALDLRDDGVAVATFDLPGAPVNVLGPAAAVAFGLLLDRLDRDANIRACVLRSGKPDAWIAGADIEQFATLRDATDAEALSWQGQAMADRVERCRVPVVAAVHGACLGGGLEVALACAWRVATDDAKTTFGLPEVQLGLIPGMGGTQRLPRRVGLQAALDLILTGTTLRARQARKLGIVDDLVHSAILMDVALQRARELAGGQKKRGGVARPRSAAALLLDGNPVGRTIVFSRAREQVLKKTGGHYPAPLAALDAVHDGYIRGREAGLKQEARRFGELAVTGVSRELVYLFHATTALKKDDAATPGVAPRRVRQLGVVGAGFMGAGIAALAARRGTPVRLKDGDLARVARGVDAVRALLRDALVRRRATALEVGAQQALVTGTADYTGFRRADLVVEAVFEDLALKRRVVDDVEDAAPDAVVATNTSTIPVREIADGATRPERVVGMHFFSPVAKMPLLEIVRTAESAPEAVATAVAYGRQLGKTVIVVGDGPGFYVNRILAPYLNEAGWLLDVGVPVERIDAALVGWGFPVGPFQLMDEVGFEVAARAGQVVADAFGARLTPAPALQRVLESGRAGRKGRQGFYRYDANGRRAGVDASVYAIAGVRPLSGVALGTERVADGAPPSPYGAAPIVERTVYPMLDEAVRCLDDGVIGSPRDGDVGAVFGIGYPAFRGGPFRTLDALGPAAVVQALDALARLHSGRFAPGAGLTAMASEGGRAHRRE